MTSIVARAAAAVSGFPAVVKTCAGAFNASMISARPITALSGRPDASDLPTLIRSGSSPNCWIDHHLPVRPIP